jgi:CubicO group peptidase (beta-lactamase class C family)
MTARHLAGAVAAACALAVLTAPAAAIAQPGPDGPDTATDAAAIDAVVQAHVGATRLPGVAVAVVRDGRAPYVRGYGHDSNGEPVTEATPMRLGAVSESFTAMALMLVAQRSGRITLDDPVVEHLPEFATADPRSVQITVRHLLEHTSGLPEVTSGRPGSLQEAVAGLREVTLDAAPGDRRAHSEAGYQVAARLLEVLQRGPFDQALTDLVLRPAGMTATTTVDNLNARVPGLVDGYGQFLGLRWPRSEPDRFVSGSAGIVSTAGDLAMWVRLHAGWGLRTVVGGDALIELRQLAWDEVTVGPPHLYGPPTEYRLHGRTATASASVVLLTDHRHGVAVVANTGAPLDGLVDGLVDDEVDALVDELLALVGGAPPAGPGLPRAFLTELALAAVVAAAAAAAVIGLRRRGRRRVSPRREP